MPDIHNHFVSVGALRLNVFDWGTDGQPPLILLHGLASTSRMFDLLAPELIKEYHVVAYDQRGHGLSDKPDDGYDFESIASDLDRLLDALGFGAQPVALAGHSWGASTVLYYAATRLQRVRRSILIDGGLTRVTDSFARLEDMAPPQARNRTLDDLKTMIRQHWLGDAWRPELEPLVLSIYDLSDPLDVQPRLTLARHMQIAEALWNFRPLEYYARVVCPILNIAARRAGEPPNARLQAYAAEAQAQNPRLQFVEMLDTIHDIPWQRPRELAELMRRFLAPVIS